MHDAAVEQVRRELGVESEARQRLREIECRVWILTGEEELRGVVLRRDDVHVVRLRDDVGEADEAERGEGDAGRKELARRVADPQVRQDR